MTLFDEITEKLSKKCLYVVSLPDYPKGEISRPDTITKGGYTEDDLEYRISKFNFSVIFLILLENKNLLM